MADAVIKLKAVDEASGVFERAAQNVGKQLRAMRAEANESGETALHKMLSGGPDKVVEGAFGAAGMGVQGLVAGFVGEQASALTDKMVEMRNQIAEGKASASDLVNQFARGVPILGSFVSTFENIRELITGEQLAIDEQNEQTELTNKLYESQLELAKKVREEREAYLVVLRNIHNEERNVGMVGVDRQKELNRQREETANDAAREAAQQQTREQQKTLAAAQAAMNDYLTTHKTDMESAREQRENQLKALRQVYPNDPKSYGPDVAAQFATLSTPSDEERAPDELQNKLNAANQDLEKAKTAAQSQYKNTVRENAELRKKEDAQAEYEIGIARAEASRQAELMIADTRAKAQAQGLERNREFLKSHLVSLAADYNHQVSDLISGTSKRIREESDWGQKIGIAMEGAGQFMAATEKNRQDVLDAQHQEWIRQNEQAGHAAQVNDQLAKGRIESLRAEAAMGNLAAGMEAQRLEIQTKYNEKREEYNRILRDEAATLAQKAQAQKQLTGLDQQEQLALLLANTPSRGFMLNPMQEVGRTTGVAARAREENDPLRQQLVQAREAATRAEQQRKSMIDILAMVGHALTSGAGTPPRVLTGSRVR